MANELPALAGQPCAPHGAGACASLRETVAAVAATARCSVTEAVREASQRLLIEVLMRSENVGLREYRLQSLLDNEMPGNCAALWSLSEPTPALARDTGRGWRMDGALPPTCNLTRNWFLLSVPVQFEGARDYSLVLVDGEADGLHRREEALPGLNGIDRASLKLSKVFLREDEIITSAGSAFVQQIAPYAMALRCAIVGGACLGVVDKWFDSAERNDHRAALAAWLEQAGLALRPGASAHELVPLLSALHRHARTLAWWPLAQSSMVGAEDRLRLVKLASL